MRAFTRAPKDTFGPHAGIPDLVEVAIFVGEANHHAKNRGALNRNGPRLDQGIACRTNIGIILHAKNLAKRPSVKRRKSVVLPPPGAAKKHDPGPRLIGVVE